MLTVKKEDGNIHDRFARSSYLRAAFMSLAVDVGGGIYLRAAIYQYYSCTYLVYLLKVEFHSWRGRSLP